MEEGFCWIYHEAVLIVNTVSSPSVSKESAKKVKQVNQLTSTSVVKYLEQIFVSLSHSGVCAPFVTFHTLKRA
jgi:hypothetical protein